jgi:integrase
MSTMRPPTVPDKAVPVVPVADLRTLLTACEEAELPPAAAHRAHSPHARAGRVRRAEVVRLTVGSIDLDSDVAVVLGKGRRRAGSPEATEPDRH